MAQTDLAQVNDQIQTFWSPLFMKELREQHLLGALVNKDYEGEIKQLGNTVRVSQINAPTGQLLTAGVDADAFASQLLTTTKVDVVANKRAVSAFEFVDLVELQSQIGAADSEIRESLLFAVMQQMNNYLYSLVAPSTAAPDHSISGVTDFNASQLGACRTLAAQAKWMKQKGWWALLSPSYYQDLLNAQTLTSSDYIPDQPVVGGQIVNQRFGFNILEDNSDGILTISPAAAGTDCGLLFHPDFLHLVMQTQPTFKVSDLHSNKQFGYVISVDIVFGAALGISGNVKHIEVYNT
jgi:hypothetical protein